jgi:hypothetical protein
MSAALTAGDLRGLAIPNGPRVQEQLLYLSATVLARLAP